MQTIKLETGETLAFDEAVHLYTIDGVACPGTHALMERHGIVKPLDAFAAPYAERGKRIHLLTQYDDENDLDESSVESLDRPYLEAWRRFRKTSGFKFTGVEQLVGSANYWAATLVDRPAILDGAEYVINIKTISNLDDIEKSHKKHAVQLAIEAILYGAEHMVGVYLDPHGEYADKKFNDDAAYNLAGSILQANGAAHKYMATRRKVTKAMRV